MLWHKAWLETRGRFLFLLAIVMAVCVVLVPRFGAAAMTPEKMEATKAALLRALHYAEWPALAVVLAGAGINTQTMSGTRHAIHPSMLFTLSLPVRRRRLLAVRAAAGAAEVLALLIIGCAAAMTFSPFVRAHGNGAEMLVYVFTAAVSTSMAYSLGVLAATFLDESWQIYAGCTGLVVLWQVQSRVPALAPAPFGQIHWPQLAFSAVMAALLLAAAVRVAERKQY